MAMRTLPIVLALAIGGGAIAATLFTGGKVHAEDATADKAEAAERCAIRLALAIAGRSPDPPAMKATDPQAASVDALLATPDFADHFARFINSEFNGGPAMTGAEDPVYFVAKRVIDENRPWADLFVGPFDPEPQGDGMVVNTDPNGLGYFRSNVWRRRYAGNESSGLMLSGAFRILSNTTGLELTPSVGSPGDDRTTTGRQAEPCRQCHFDSWYALDTVAKLLPRKQGQDDSITFTGAQDGPQQLLGKSVADDKALLQALVESDSWRFAQCRNVFKYLYGRPENQCEAPVFDKCVDALTKGKTIRAAVAAVAKDASFCQ